MLTTNPIKLFAVFSTGQCSTHVITNTHFLIYRNAVWCTMCPYPYYAYPEIQSTN